MRLMGLDVGDRRIGVAVSDPLGLTSQGLATINRKDLDYDLQQIVDYIEELQVDKIVVGLPKNMNGTVGSQAEKVKEFMKLLTEKKPIETIYWDERLTTVAAHRTLIQGDVSRKKRKKVVDKIAAVMILQGYLDSQH